MKRYTDSVLSEIDKEKQLFLLVQSIGEGVFDSLHIIGGDYMGEYSSVEYRIYHSGGFCWDIRMEYQFSDETDYIGNNVEVKPYYDFSENWDGFKESGIDFAISEVLKLQKKQ